MKMPRPVKEHQWLKKLVGAWDADVEMFMQPGCPPEKIRGTERVRAIGDFWISTENIGSFMGKPFTGCLTLGYDPEARKFVGTWIDSMTSRLWLYEGELDASGKTLTLNTEGPSPESPGKLAKFTETITLKSRNHKSFSSSMRAKSGKRVTMMTVDYRRVK